MFLVIFIQVPHPLSLTVVCKNFVENYKGKRAMAMEGNRVSCTMVPLPQPCEIMSRRGLHFPLSLDKLLQSTPRGHYSAAYQKF